MKNIKEYLNEKNIGMKLDKTQQKTSARVMENIQLANNRLNERVKGLNDDKTAIAMAWGTELDKTDLKNLKVAIKNIKTHIKNLDTELNTYDKFLNLIIKK